jgi:anti-sigma factor RsiW
VNSRTDTTGHPDVAEISDFAEGLLPPSRTTEVRLHLDACDLCADAHLSLEEIRGLLGAVPAPVQMPVDVADRIDAALAAEAPLSATTTAVGPAPAPAVVSALPSSSDEDDEPSDGDEAHVSRETSALADRPAGRPHGATGPGRKDRRRGRRRTIVMGAVLTVAVLGAGSLLLHSLGIDRPDATPQHKQTTAADAFSGNSLQSQVAGLITTDQGGGRGTVSQAPGLGTGSQPQTPDTTGSANTLLQPSASVPDCIRQGISGNGDVLGAKLGTYGGKNAYLVVLPDTEDSTQVIAYVVDAACVGREPLSPGTILWKQSFTRS